MPARPLDDLELAAIWRELHARRLEWRALIGELEHRHREIMPSDTEKLAELERLANRVQEVAVVGGDALTAEPAAPIARAPRPQ